VLIGVKQASLDFWALNTVLFMGLLVIQFGLGMYLNLFVTIPSRVRQAESSRRACLPPLPAIGEASVKCVKGGEAAGDHSRGVCMAGLRFCAYQYQHLPLDALRGRWRDAERSGFDVLWNCDTVVAAGRDPASIRHSLVCFPPLTPWQSVPYFQDMVGRFGEIGIDEFVLYWPQTWAAAPREEAVFEEVTATVMPRLRAR
jgi:hypothetical protein